MWHGHKLGAALGVVVLLALIIGLGIWLIMRWHQRTRRGSGTTAAGQTARVIPITVEYPKRDSRWTPQVPEVRDYVLSELFPGILATLRSDAQDVPMNLEPLRDEDVVVVPETPDSHLQVTLLFQLSGPASPTSVAAVEDELTRRATRRLLKWAREQEESWRTAFGTPAIRVDDVVFEETSPDAPTLRKVRIRFSVEKPGEDTLGQIDAECNEYTKHVQSGVVERVTAVLKTHDLPRQGTCWRWMDLAGATEHTVVCLEIHLSTPDCPRRVLRAERKLSNLPSSP
jgi:hypothetical protein